MFAGRYLWWVMVGVATFVFFAVYFPRLAEVYVSVSGCEAGFGGGCDHLSVTLQTIVAPLGYFLGGLIVLLAVAGRILFVKLSILWFVAVLVWSAVSASFLTKIGVAWTVQSGMESLLQAFPVESLFLAAFLLFIAFPLEDFDAPDNAAPKMAYLFMVLVAAFSVVASFAGIADFDTYVGHNQISSVLLPWLIAMQGWARWALVESGLGRMPQLLMLLAFVVPAGILAIIRTRPFAYA